MKKLRIVQLAILFFLSGTVFSQHKYNMDNQGRAIYISPKVKGGSLWGEFNVGYSNFGATGKLALSYRKENIYLGTSYYKSHLCCTDIKKKYYFPEIRNIQEHKSIQTISVFSGIIFPGKLTPSLSVGVSWVQFDYENTVPIAENLSFKRVWESIIGSDYENEKLSSQSINKIGIPIDFNLHFSPKHFAGVDATVNANLNTHNVIISGGVGIHLGRIIQRS